MNNIQLKFGATLTLSRLLLTIEILQLELWSGRELLWHRPGLNGLQARCAIKLIGLLAIMALRFRFSI